MSDVMGVEAVEEGREERGERMLRGATIPMHRGPCDRNAIFANFYISNFCFENPQNLLISISSFPCLSCILYSSYN